MNPYHQFVSDYARFIREGRNYPLGKFAKCPRQEIAGDAPKALIFSPHPDDEVIIGGLPLRLLRQSKWNVLNVAVTQGSNKARQAGRLAELQGCCDCIGFGLIQTSTGGLERVNLKTREEQPGAWAESVNIIAAILNQHQPRVIFFPHEDDWNSTHIGTHFLVKDALKLLSPGFGCYGVETEFWRAMDSPNLLVEVSGKDLGDLMTALTFHVGEVRRNPYHLTLPAWMADNVRRGSELLGGQGAVAPEFTFATLYRVMKFSGGKVENVAPRKGFLSSEEDPAKWFGS